LADLRLKDQTVYVFGPYTGKPEKIRDRNGNTLCFTYNAARIVRITTHNGRYLDFQYDTSGRITEIKDILGHI
jgi:YD repeat-containing protein